jgi:hypothetical protein
MIKYSSATQYSKLNALLGCCCAVHVRVTLTVLWQCLPLLPATDSKSYLPIAVQEAYLNGYWNFSECLGSCHFMLVCVLAGARTRTALKTVSRVAFRVKARGE